MHITKCITGGGVRFFHVCMPGYMHEQYSTFLKYPRRGGPRDSGSVCKYPSRQQQKRKLF